MQAKSRRKDLDCAKGLGIFLVVLGHLVPGTATFPAGNHWYWQLRGVLYEFHMPFFMYLSGYVTFLSGAAFVSSHQWSLLVRKRSQRLLLPFIVFGLAIVVGKWVSGRVLHVDNFPDSILYALLSLVWDTDYSPATSVWYVAVLFVFCVLTPPFLWLTRRSLLPLVIFALVLYFVPLPHVIYLNRIGTYYIFFALGGMCVQHEEAWLRLIDRHALLVFVAFILLIVLFFMPQSGGLTWEVRMLAAGCLSMPALHGVIRRPMLLNSTILLRLGLFSFVIYLLNTPCIGLAKGVMLKFIPWDGYYFLLYVLALLFSGIAGPILIKRYIFARIPPVDRVTD